MLFFLKQKIVQTWTSFSMSKKTTTSASTGKRRRNYSKDETANSSSNKQRRTVDVNVDENDDDSKIEHKVAGIIIIEQKSAHCMNVRQTCSICTSVLSISQDDLHYDKSDKENYIRDADGAINIEKDGYKPYYTCPICLCKNECEEKLSKQVLLYLYNKPGPILSRTYLMEKICESIEEMSSEVSSSIIDLSSDLVEALVKKIDKPAAEIGTDN